MSDTADKIRSIRQQFAAPGSGHDRRIFWLRIILPAFVGALAAFLALAPFTVQGELSFVLDKNSVDIARERMRVTDALYRGEDSRNRPFSLKAGSAVQKTSSDPIVDMKELSARILLSDGPAQIRANEGRYDLDRELVDVDGPIQVESSGGYRLSTSDVRVSLKNQKLRSKQRVEGRTNIGTFRADRLEADLAARTVTLNGNARLRIQQNGLKRR